MSSALEGRLKSSIDQEKRQLDDFRENVEELLKAFAKLPVGVATVAKELLVESLGLAPSATETLEAAQTGEEDLTGKPALECARIIFAERKNAPTHFSVIAREAMRRGYRGRSAGSTEEVENRTINSFWAAMSRADDMESVGKGLYRVREQPARREAGQPQHGKTSVTVAADSWAGKTAVLIKEAGRPMPVREIADELRKRGVTDRSGNQFLGTLWSALWRRNKDLFLKTPDGFQLRTKDFVLV